MRPAGSAHAVAAIITVPMSANTIDRRVMSASLVGIDLRVSRKVTCIGIAIPV
jgi:hypothetical protein